MTPRTVALQAPLSILVEVLTYLIFLGSKVTVDGDCSHEIRRCLLLGRRAMTNIDSVLKSRDITLPTQVHIVKVMVFPVVVYGCEKVKEGRKVKSLSRVRLFVTHGL